MNGIEAQIGNEADVVRLDLLSSVGRRAAQAYQVCIVPATLVISRSGEIVVRHTGMPEPESLVAALRRAATNTS